MMGLGVPELAIIFAIVFILFGAKRLPEFGKAIGQTIREFKGIKKDFAETETSIRGTVRDIDREMRS